MATKTTKETTEKKPVTLSLEQIRKVSQCHSCLWAGCECKEASNFKPQQVTFKGQSGCAGWTYYD